MSSFYLYSFLFAVIALGFVAYPWFKDRNAKRRFEISNANVIKQRIEEIEREAKEGLIDADEMQTAIDEMKLALAEESAFQQAQQEEAEKTTIAARSAKIPLIIGAVPALLIGAWTYYDANQLSGLKDLVDATNNIEALSHRILVQQADNVAAEEFNKYALVIRQQLRKDPSDVNGWQWLGRLRMTLGQSEEASQAFDKALALSPDDQAMRMKYAQALMMMGEEENLQNALRQVVYLTQVDPQNRDYRLLLTVIAAQLNDADTAFENFALIKNQLSANSTLYVSLVEQLRKMGAPETLLALNGAPQGVQAAESADSQLDVQRGFRVEVSIADALKAKLPDDGFLIVFAQDANSGARMPLAVKRLRLPSFPISVDLTTADAMITNFSLKNAEQVTITARISKDEDVMTSSGELQGSLSNLPVIDELRSIQLTINEEVQ